MRDYILLSIFKKFLFLIIFIIFSDMLKIESLSAKARMNTGTYCYNCKHPYRCSMCFHTYPKKNNSYTDKNEDRKDSNPKKSRGISNIILDGISFGNRQSSAENDDEDTENQDENTMNRNTNTDGENENIDDEDSGNNENESDDENEDSDNNENESDDQNEDGGNNENESDDENEDSDNNENESDTLNNSIENSADTTIGYGNNMMLPDNTMAPMQQNSTTDLYGAPSAGGDNYQEIVQDVIEYFRELGVLDESKLSQLSQGLKNGICIACKTNGLVHIIPGKKIYNICSNCFERMLDGFIGNGSGNSTVTNLNGSNSGVMYGNNNGTAGIYNNGQSMDGSMQGLNMNGDMSGQNNATANAASGIVDAALSSIPGMSGKLENALSNGISSMLHKDSGDQGANNGFGYATPIVGLDGLPVSTNMPFNQNAPTSAIPTTTPVTAGQPPATTNGEKMVLNAIGQLVPMSSLAGTSAPYGYKQNPDGTFSPAMPDNPVTATDNTPKNTASNNPDKKLDKINSSINNVISTTNTIASAAAPITGLISGLITNSTSGAANDPTAAADKKAAAADKKAATADKKAAKKAAAADKKAATADKQLKKRGADSTSKKSEETKKTSKKRMKKRK